MNKSKKCFYIRIEAIDSIGRKFFSQPFFVGKKENSPNYCNFSGNWFKGNLHTHTNYSHGWFSPEITKQIYQKAGYNFLALTDHDWFEKMEGNGKTHFVPRYVSSNVDFLNEPPSFVSFSGSEQGSIEKEKDVQLLMINCCRSALDQKGIQEEINATNAVGGFVIYHEFPKTQSFRETIDIMNNQYGYWGIEIFNSSQGPLENETRVKVWDELLSLGKKVWGFANDDIHEIWWPHFKGYNMVNARNNDRKFLIESIKQGYFYASTGLDVSKLCFSNKNIYVFVPEAEMIRFICNDGKLLFEGEGNEATYNLIEKKVKFCFKREFPLQKHQLISHYEFISENKISKKQKKNLEKRFPIGSIKLNEKSIILDLEPAHLKPALDIFLLDNDFSLTLFRENVWYGVFMIFKFDEKIYNGLVQFDTRTKIHFEEDLNRIQNFLKVFRYESRNKMMIEMSFQVKNEQDIERTFENARRFFPELKQDIENCNFTKLEKMEEQYLKQK